MKLGRKESGAQILQGPQGHDQGLHFKCDGNILMHLAEEMQMFIVAVVK